MIKIQPDFVEESFKHIRPNIHYIPASITNLTETVENVLDRDNEPEMKQIVMNANKWCQVSLTAEALADSAVDTLENYIELLEKYDSSWRSRFSKDFSTKHVDDLVPCSV